MRYTLSCLKNAALVLFIFAFVYCLEVIPEKGNITYVNPKYMKQASLVIRRYGRRGKYFINTDAYNIHTWTNNVTANMVFYEYLHNEYRRSFVELHYKFCDLIHKEPYVGSVLAHAGVRCPLPAGYYRLSNISFQVNFPNVWPFQRARVHTYFTHTVTNETILECTVDYRFIDNNKIKRVGN